MPGIHFFTSEAVFSVRYKYVNKWTNKHIEKESKLKLM